MQRFTLAKKRRILIIWVCEIVLQQTRVETRQESLPEFCRKISYGKSLSSAEIDEVLLIGKV